MTMSKSLPGIFSNPFLLILVTVLIKIPVFFTHHIQEDSFITWRVAGNLLNEINDRVRMDTPYLELDTTAESGTDDAVLYDAIVAIGWENDVIEE